MYSKSILMSFSFCVFVLLALATNDDDSGNIKNNKTVVVQLYPGYLTWCGIDSEGASRNIQITISVDIVKARTTKTNYKKYTFIKNNDDNHEPNIRFYGIEIPGSGIFEISVSVEALSCFQCCFSLSCPSGSGKPFFEVESPDRFRVEDVPSGYQINLFPFQEGCL